MRLSSRGRGHYPFTVATGVRIPVGVPFVLTMNRFCIHNPFGLIVYNFSSSNTSILFINDYNKLFFLKFFIFVIKFRRAFIAELISIPDGPTKTGSADIFPVQLIELFLFHLNLIFVS